MVALHLGFLMVFWLRMCVSRGEMSDFILNYELSVCKACSAPNRTIYKFENLIPNLTIIYTNNTDCNLCDKCHCDKECDFFGDCCSDRHIRNSQINFTCEPDLKIKIVSECSTRMAYSNDTFRRCTRANKYSYTETVHVSIIRGGNKTALSFRNKFCAICNGFTEYVKWNMSFECSHIPQGVAHAVDINEMFSGLIKSPACSVEQVPGGIKTRRCRPVTTPPKCNVTGKWKYYNADTEQSCHAYTNPTFDGYNNIFCKICNEDMLNTYSRCPALSDYKFVAFSGILDFDEGADQGSTRCGTGYYPDVLTKSCRKILCPPIHQLQGYDCVLNAELNVILFTVELTLFPRGNQTILYSRDLQVGKLLLKYYKERLSMNDAANRWGLYDMLGGIYQKPNGTGPPVISRVDIILHPTILKQESFANVTALLSNIVFDNIVIISNGVQYELSSFLTTSVENAMASHLITSFRFRLMRRGAMGLPGDILSLTFSSNYIRRNCPQIEYNDNEYSSDFDNITLRKSDTLIPKEEITFAENRSILVCLKYIQQQKVRITDQEGKDYTIALLSFICLTTSMIFLAISFFVYCRFPILRTIPGINLMFLMASLFKAQGLFLIGPSTTTNRMICNVMAVLIHYFWLVTFSWMIICTFHAYRLFRNILSSVRISDNKCEIVTKYSIMAYCVPLVIITGNITIHYLVTEQNTIGYGEGKSCFVNPGLSTILSFGIPVLLTILSTAYCFICTIVSINRASNDLIATSKKSKSSVLIILKLSTVTCLSWVFGLLGSALALRPFKYIFVVLAAGQGIFVFLGFIANMRIVNLFRNRTKEEIGSMKTKEIKLSTSEDRYSKTSSFSNISSAKINSVSA